MNVDLPDPQSMEHLNLNALTPYFNIEYQTGLPGDGVDSSTNTMTFSQAIMAKNLFEPFMLQHAMMTDVPLSGNVLMQPPLSCCPRHLADQLEEVATGFKTLADAAQVKAVQMRAMPSVICSSHSKDLIPMSPSSDPTTPSMGPSSSPSCHAPTSSPLARLPISHNSLSGSGNFPPYLGNGSSPMSAQTPESVQLSVIPPGSMPYLVPGLYPELFHLPPYPLTGFPLYPEPGNAGPTASLMGTALNKEVGSTMNQAYAPLAVSPRNGPASEIGYEAPSTPVDMATSAFNLNAHASSFQPSPAPTYPSSYPSAAFPTWFQDRSPEEGWRDFAALQDHPAGFASPLAHISTTDLQDLLSKYQRREVSALDTKIALHDLGSCKPCAFFHFPKKLCNNIRECHFCHHEEHRRYSMKCWKRRRQRITKDIGVQALELVNRLTNDITLIRPEAVSFYREADYIMACRSLKLSVEGNFPASIQPLHHFYLRPEVIEMVEQGKMEVEQITKDDLLPDQYVEMPSNAHKDDTVPAFPSPSAPLE